jgi:arylamine N-acetyltransferase
MCTILDELEFKYEIRMGDMKHAPNLHCALIVSLDGKKYLIDPGYLITEPVELPSKKNLIYETTSNLIEIASTYSDYHLYTIEQNQKKWRYKLKSPAVDRITFKGFWQDSFSCNMMNSILVSRSENDGRLYFQKDRFSQVQKTGRKNKKIKKQPERFVANTFGIDTELIQKALKILKLKQEAQKNG